MSDRDFKSAAGGSPFPRTAAEYVEKGMTPEQAKHRMAQHVFGDDYKTDAKGNPIEQGKGSLLQPTPQHLQAMDIDRQARGARGIGWQSGLEFDPRLAELERQIAELKRRPPPRKPGRKPKIVAPAPELP